MSVTLHAARSHRICDLSWRSVLDAPEGGEMIDGPGELHWATAYDEDDEPFGETCRCEIGEDHEVGE